MEPIIKIEHLDKWFKVKDMDVHALDDISLDIYKGEIYGIIGMSGAGKSTLVRCLNFLERPTSGDVIVDGKNLAKLSNKELRATRKDIGMIFQHFNLLMQRNVLDNVCFPMELAGIKKKEAREKALEYLKVVGLEEKAKAYPAQLSGGQKQRVAIARVLASDPKILLCDEATSALDPQTTKSILQLLKEINQKYGITIVIITHEMSVVQEICSHVAIIDHGKLAEHGLVSDIFTAPKSKEAKKLIPLGTYAYFADAITKLGGNKICSKAIDDRAGCQILIDMIKSDMKYDTEFLFSVQEEIGLRGAGAGAYTINPDIAIVIETTTAADIDSSEGAERVCVLGEGPVILYRDRRTMYDRELYNLAVSVAEKNGIKWQTKTKVAGGNDSGSIQISRGGVKMLAVSVPCRYLHSPSTVMDMGDYELCEKLAEKLAEAVVEV